VHPIRVPLKVLSLLLLALSLLSGGGLLAAADSIEGLWQVENKEAHIRIERCGDNLCAWIVWMKDPTDDKAQLRLDVNHQQRLFLEAQSNVITGQKTYYAALVELESAIGTLPTH
jgi:uncharacterized protein (DUF2147 family)